MHRTDSSGDDLMGSSVVGLWLDWISVPLVIPDVATRRKKKNAEKRTWQGGRLPSGWNVSISYLVPCTTTSEHIVFCFLSTSAIWHERACSLHSGYAHDRTYTSRTFFTSTGGYGRVSCKQQSSCQKTRQHTLLIDWSGDGDRGEDEEGRVLMNKGVELRVQ